MFGTAQWHTIYSQRVALMMKETLKAGAKMLWVGCRSCRTRPSLTSMQMLNAIYKAQASGTPGCHLLPDLEALLERPGSVHRLPHQQLGPDGARPGLDGIHIAPPGGCDIIAIAAVKEIEAVWHVHLGV